MMCVLKKSGRVKRIYLQKRIYSIVLTFFIICCSNLFASESIRISSTDHPPLSQPDLMKGKGYGVMYDITKEAFDAVDAKVVIEFIPMARVIWSVTSGRYQANLGVVQWFAKENKVHLVQAVDLINVNIKFFYKKQRFPKGIFYQNLSELKKYRIGSIRGSSTLPILEKADIKAELTSQLEHNFNKLNLGRIDLTVAVDLTGWTIIQDLFSDHINDFAMIDRPLLSMPASLIFHKKHKQAINTFQRGLDIILKNGTYHQVVRRYYSDTPDLKDILPQNIFKRMQIK